MADTRKLLEKQARLSKAISKAISDEGFVDDEETPLLLAGAIGVLAPAFVVTSLNKEPDEELKKILVTMFEANYDAAVETINSIADTPDDFMKAFEDAKIWNKGDVH